MSESGQHVIAASARLWRMQLQGVRTTGIYCRASCRARPNAENVQPMPNALAALAAGFRPCLVCRPDRLPDLGLAKTSPQVASALCLIADGFLDESSTDALAVRVGYSTRQLVRLFEQEIGATPDFVARVQRAHLARRLLDESELTITEVAFAAGFQSIRQMNRVMRELFAFSPSELRKKRRRGDRLEALDGGLRLRVPYDGHLDGTRMIRYLAGRAIPGVEEVVGDEVPVYRRTTNACGHAGVVEVRDLQDRAHLEVTLHLATFASTIEQVQRVRSLFGLARSDGDAESALLRDPHLGEHVRKTPGLRLPGCFDPFETCVRILVGQQVSVAGASTVCGRLVERLGERVDVPLDGSLHSLFPTANALAGADPAMLDMPRARARAILGFAAAVAAGELDLYRRDDLSETLARLQALPGIGPWSAHLMAARVFAHSDAFPSSDLGLRKSAAGLRRNGDLSARELERYAEPWRPWRTTAAAYLWMVIPEQPMQAKRAKRQST